MLGSILVLMAAALWKMGRLYARPLSSLFISEPMTAECASLPTRLKMRCQVIPAMDKLNPLLRSLKDLLGNTLKRFVDKFCH